MDNYWTSCASLPRQQFRHYGHCEKHRRVLHLPIPVRHLLHFDSDAEDPVIILSSADDGFTYYLGICIKEELNETES